MEGDMTEQKKFEAYANTQGYSVEKDEQGLYRSVEAFCHWGTWQAAIASREPMPADKIDDVFSSALANMRKHSKIATGALTDEDRYEFHVVRAIERFHGIGE